MLLGSHLSIEGGPHRALERADGYGFRTVAMFVRNQLQWSAPALSDEAVRAFRNAKRRLGMRPIVAHASYLVNLAGEDAVREKSIAAMAGDLDRCGRLGIEYLVLHPGSNPDPDAGIERIAEGLERIFAECPRRRVKVLLETTAGGGSTLGRTFTQLAAILSACRKRSRRLGVCLDTCHIFAAGYDIRTPAAYERTMAAFDVTVGRDKLLAVHLNDAKRPLGSRVDRHEHIGRGKIGTKGFRPLLTDPRMAEVPLILETPKGKDPQGRDWDEINAAKVRRIAGRQRRSGRASSSPASC